jgi:DNA-binding HxlR family transcriptional regulator
VNSNGLELLGEEPYQNTVRVEYSLTDVGKGFEPVLLSAASFSMMHMPTTVFKDGKPRTPDQLLAGQR